MPNKNYISGRQYEYKCIVELRRQGAVEAQRTAGSHGSFDIIAIMPDGLIRLIQVKSHGAQDDIKKLDSLPIPEKLVTKELWHWVTRKGWEITYLSNL